MLKVKNKRFVAAMLSIMLVLEMFVIQPKTAYAADVNIPQGKSESRVISSDGKSLSVLLYDATTSATVKSKPSWVTVSKNQYSTTFSVKISSNSNYSKRDGKVEFKEGSKTWTLKIMQSAKPTPTNTPKPTNKPKPKATNTPKPKATNTPKPKATNTPTPKLEASPSSVSFGANGGTTTVQTSGKVGTLRADRVNGDMWFVATVSGGTVSIEVKANDGAARTGYLDITDTGSGKSVRVTIKQEAKAGVTQPPQDPTTCEHTWGDWKTTKDAGCETTGTKTRSCTKCSAKQTQTIAKRGHKDDGKTTTKNATCTAAGYTVSICSRCKKEIGSRTVIPAKGHSWGNWETDEEAKCEVDGKKHRTCTACGAREDAVITKLGHKSNGEIIRKDPTCTEDGYTVPKCYRCGAELGEHTVLKAGHIWGEWKTKEEPGCKTPGKKIHVCSRCGEIEEASIPALGHLVEGQVRTVTPAVGVDGYTVVVCSRCGAEMEGKKRIPALTATPTPTPKPKLKANRSTVSFPYNGKNNQGQQIQEEVSFSGVQGNLSVDFETKDGKKPEWLNYTVKGSKIAFTVNPVYLQNNQQVSVIVRDTKTKKTVVVTVILYGCSEEEEIAHRRNVPTPKPESPSDPPGPSITEDPGANPPPKQPIVETVFESKVDEAPKPKPKPAPKPQSNDAPKQSVNNDSHTDDDPLVFEVNPSSLTFTSCLEGEKYVFVDGNTEPYNVSYTLQSDADWCTVRKTTVPYMYYVKVNESKGDFTRVGHIEFVDKNTGATSTLEVSQPGSLVTVEFYRNRGIEEVPNKFTFHVGKQYSLPNGPEALDGRAFIGWYTLPKGGVEVTKQDVVNEDITQLYAHYEPDMVQVDFVTFDHPEEWNKGFTALQSKTVKYGEPIGDIFPQVENPKEYRIVAWRDPDGNYYNKYTKVLEPEKLVLTAEWGRTDEYTIFFEGNGNLTGTMTPMVCKYDKQYTLPKVLFDDGKGFEEWRDAPEGGTRAYDNRYKFVNLVGKEVSSITLFAKWKVKRTVKYYDAIRWIPAGVGELGHIFSPWGPDDYLGSVELKGLKVIGWSQDSDDIFNPSPEFALGKQYATDGNNLLLYPVYQVNEKDKYPVFFYDTRSGKVEVKYVTKDAKSIEMPVLISVDDRYKLGCWTTEKGCDAEHPPAVDHQYTPGTTYDISMDLEEKGYLVYHAFWEYTVGDLILDYNYDDRKPKTIKVDDSEYSLPTPERAGYTLLGWCTKDKLTTEEKVTGNYILYKGGSPYPVPKEGITLYAIWEPIKFAVDYYDSFSGALLWHTELTTEGNVTQSYINIEGLRFVGWTEYEDIASDNPRWLARPGIHKIFNSANKGIELPYKKTTIKLYSCYSVPEIESGKTRVIYLPNEGYSAPYSAVFSTNETITVSSKKVTRYKNSFKGWKVLNAYRINGYERYQGGTLVPDLREMDLKRVSKMLFQPGDSVDISTASGNAQLILLQAQWKSPRKLRLDPGWGNKPIKDLTNEYQVGDTIETKKLKVEERPGHYLKCWKTSEGKTYSIDDYIDVPDRDITIIAVWEKKQFDLYYHDGFAPEEWVKVTVDSNTTLTYDPHAYCWLDVSGCSFVGWAVYDEAEWGSPILGADDGVRYDQLITPDQARALLLKDDLHICSCYTESPVPLGKIKVIYNPMGGTGGPGVEYFDEGSTDYHISDEAPTREGYIFKGWRGVIGTIDDKNYLGAVDSLKRVLKLDAIWESETTNPWRYELQKRFGKDIMPDKYFEYEYISPRWEKASDLCYFAIRTWNFDGVMRSEVAILEYKYGKWILTGHSSSVNIRSIVEYDLLTHFNDTNGRLAKAISNISYTAVSSNAYVRGALLLNDVVCSIVDIGIYWKKHGPSSKFISKAACDISNKVYGALKGVVDKTQLVAVMAELEPLIATWYMQECVVNQDLIVKGIDTLGKAAKAGFKAADMGPVRELSESIAKKINPVIAERIKKQIGFMPELKDYDVTDKISGITYDVIGCIWSIAMDQVKYYVNKKEMDPFGDFDQALQTFGKELDGNGFDPEFRKTLPDAINQIYEAYYDTILD